MEHKKIGSENQDSYDDQQKWVLDSSFDSKGHVPLRARTGAWRAAFFIIAIEFSERLSYYGLATNLVVYLTTILHQDLKTAIRNANYWAGVTTLMPLLGGFVADAYLGRYTTVLVATTIYLMGLVLLTLSWFIPGLKPCHQEVCLEPRKAHEIAFFIAIYLISIGTGGHKPSLESFGADQFDEGHAEERKMKMSYFNWWSAGLCAGILTAVIVIVFIEDRVGWGVASIILTAVMTISLLIFLVGKPFYRYRKPLGSPLTPMLQVFVAAFAKRKLPYPSDPSLLHEVSKAELNNGRLLSHTTHVKFLDKAAIIEDNTPQALQKQSPWRLATLTKVEETKLIINMIPIWLSVLVFGICAAQASTFFIKQATVMDRHVSGKNSFTIPPASIYCLTAITLIMYVTVYDKLLVPFLRRNTQNQRGINILQRVGIGMFFAVITMIIAALVEKKRLDLLTEQNRPMSVFWLAPQFIVLGVAEGFTLVGLQEYFYDQVPDSMRSLAEDFSDKRWFGKTLNSSRLDWFYWLLAGLAAANMCVFMIVAKRFPYKSVQSSQVLADSSVSDA
uniref:Major facilitator superfamily (MFS) profile domain-containing protein n=1 Tax=Brassica campestris TaxID=3711 RepID=M4CLR4_BRACM